MKKPLTILSTDWHLKKENINEIIDLVKQKIDLAKSLDIYTVFCAGDIFDSRISQRLEVLAAFMDILELFEKNSIKLVAIPGNHDKTDYTKKRSFLDAFQYHPFFRLINSFEQYPVEDQFTLNSEISGYGIYCFPFFEESIWLEKFNKILPKILENKEPNKIIISHIAVNGSMNNDNSKVNNGIEPKTFKDFNSIFLGHYHDQQKIGTNIFHFGSIKQSNFGENDKKGFTILYDDGSQEFIKSKFKEYKKVIIDLDRTSQKEINKLKQEYSNDENNVRFEFNGSDEKLKSLKKEDFTQLGIDIKCKSKEIEESIEYSQSTEVIEYTNEKLQEEFKNFCEENKLVYEEGIEFLLKRLKNGR